MGIIKSEDTQTRWKDHLDAKTFVGDMEGSAPRRWRGFLGGKAQ